MRCRCFLAALLLTQTSALALAQDKVVDHFDNCAAQATAGLRPMDLKKEQFVMDAGFTPLWRGAHPPTSRPGLRLHQALNPQSPGALIGQKLPLF